MELDIDNDEALKNYLEKRGYVDAHDTLSVKKLFGGVSNRTVRVGWPDGQAWVMKQALPKLRVNVDWFSDPNRIGVEAKALSWLGRLAPKGTIPKLIFEDPTNHLLAMEAIPEEHKNWKSELLSGRVMSACFEQCGALLGAIHRESSEQSAIRRDFADSGYFESLRMDPYYLYTATTTPSAADFMTALVQDTLVHKTSLVHGDFSPKNMLIYQGKLVLLDYEVVHFGDSAFDAGFVLAHFLSKAHHVLHERHGIASGAATFWKIYANEIAELEWAESVETRVVRHALACLLARVAGKSRLEYLTPSETTRQMRVVLALIGRIPGSVRELIAEFMQRIAVHAEN